MKNGRLSLKKVSTGAEVHDELVALDLAEVRIERAAELEAAVGLPEDVDAGIERRVLLAMLSYTPDAYGVIASSDWL